MISTPLARLLGMQRSAHARERLLELRGKHNLSEEDPLWELIAVLEEFCVQLQQSAAPPAPQLAPLPSSPTGPLPTSLRWRIAVISSAAAALQTIVLAATFVAGARAGATSTEHLLAAAFSLPAGWVVGVLLAPLFVSIATLGWHVRRREPVIGWGLTVGGSVATLALFGALWTLA